MADLPELGQQGEDELERPFVTDTPRVDSRALYFLQGCKHLLCIKDQEDPPYQRLWTECIRRTNFFNYDYYNGLERDFIGLSRPLYLESPEGNQPPFNLLDSNSFESQFDLLACAVKGRGLSWIVGQTRSNLVTNAIFIFEANQHILKGS